MQVKLVKILSAAAGLFLLSSTAFGANCVFVILGGAKEYMSLLPGIPTDISIDVEAAVKTQALRTGCMIVSTANDSEEEFYKALSRLKSSPLNRPGTNYHIAFTDHGAPPGSRINDSVILTGKGHSTTNARFMKELKNLIPKGSHVTYETNTCWGGSFAEAVFANNMDQYFSMCGGSSTAPHVMSWNLHSLSKDDGKTTGPYGAVGLSYANDFKRMTSRFPGISDFHYQAKKGDIGNLSKQPGLTTSIAFAHYKLLQAKIKSPLDVVDLSDTLMSINWKPGLSLEAFVHGNSAIQAGLVESGLVGSCNTNTKNPLTDFMAKFGPLYRTLLNQQTDTLPAPIGGRTKAARDFLLRNQRKFSALIATSARERAEFVKKNQNYPREKYADVESKWQSLVRSQNARMSEYLFHFRQLQEGKTVQAFLSRANAEDKKRFMNLLECEKQPML